MSRAGTERRLATVLFLDIVGSTHIASELGDRRWRALLGRFRGAVRAELKRHRGHEEDTAGDGFFATFAEPAQAVRGAAAIIGRAQEFGLDVRCGVHFGECERIEGRLGGIAVHIGSRVMALANAAEIIVTGTVRDLVVGSEVEFADAGTHELKGVPGTWQAWRVRSLDGNPLPPRLDEEAAATRRAGGQPTMADRQRRFRLAAGAGLVAIAAVALVLAFVVGPFSRHVPTLVKIDPRGNAIRLVIDDEFRSEHRPQALQAVNGALWQVATNGFDGLVRRDIETGDVLQTIPVDKEPSAGGFGFGSIWVAGLGDETSLERWDAVSGRRQASVPVDEVIVSLDDGPDAMWALSEGGTLMEIDPIANEVVGTYNTGTTMPGVLVALGDRLWVCDCEFHELVEFDPDQNRTVRSLSYPQSGFLIGLTDLDGTVTLWLLDIPAATLTPIDNDTGEAGQPIGIGRNLHDAAVSFESLWVAAGDRVLRIAPDDPTDSVTIRMPEGMSAGSIAADPETGSLWVGDCGCPIE
jgi:class 3 adenylate cyclase